MRLIFLILLLGKLNSASSQQTVPKSADDKLAYFLKLTDTLRDISKNSGLAMAIVYDNKLIYTGSSGYRNVEKRLPVTNNTLFEIGSCTKAFTGVIAAQLVKEGKLNWDDKVIKQIKEFKLIDYYATKNATIKDLFTHRTGLYQHYYLSYGPKILRKDLLNRLPYLSFNGSFRQNFSYNNFMYVVAGIAEERVTKKSWENLVQERIFAPLGMNRSYTNYKIFEADDDRTLSYKNDGITVIPSESLEEVGPAGSITSSINDMAKWLQMLVDKGQWNNAEFLTPSQFNYLTSPLTVRNPAEEIFYGIGWDVDTKRNIIYHDGRTAGQSSRILLIPEKGFGVVMLCNQKTELQNLLIRYATNIFVDNNFEKLSDFENFVKATAQPTNTGLSEAMDISEDAARLSSWQNYVGKYYHPAYGTVSLGWSAKNKSSFEYYDFKGWVKFDKVKGFTAITKHVTGNDSFPLTFQTSKEKVVTGIEVAFPYTKPVLFKKL